VSQKYFTILSKVQIDLDPMLHQSIRQTGMLFSERRYADDLPPIQYRDPIFGMIGTKALGPTQSVDRIPNIGSPARCDSYRLSENDMIGAHFVNYSWDSILEETSKRIQQ
jgi:hypothetical protein